MKRIALQRLATACLANWFFWFAAVVLMGGTPDSGASTGGRYYLEAKGSLTEVSHATYVYGWVHMVASVCGLVLFAVTVLYLYRTKPPNEKGLFGKRHAIVMVATFLVCLVAIAVGLLFAWP